MIEIKRSCNSSIRNDLEKRQIIFGAFTIKITEADYTAFDWLLRDKKLNAADLLKDLIDAGIEYYLDGYADPEVTP